jgi:hypothetical protein
MPLYWKWPLFLPLSANGAILLQISAQHSSYEFVESLPVGSPLRKIIFVRDNAATCPCILRSNVAISRR